MVQCLHHSHPQGHRDWTVNHIALDKQHDAVKQFVLSLPADSNGTVLELEGRAVACVLPPPSENGEDDEPWTNEKNERRCELIDRKYKGNPLSPAEALELARLQEQMIRYRERVAPLPLEAARRLHQDLLEKAARAQPDNA